MAEVTSKGFVFTGTLDGQDFPIVVMVPVDNPQSAQIQFPRIGEAPGPCLAGVEIFSFLGGDAPADVKDTLKTAVKLVVKLCEDECWEDATLFYMRKLVRYIEDPEEEAARWLWLGANMEGRQDYEEAAACYRKAVELGPADEKVCYFSHNNLAYSLNQIGQHQAAESHCREAIRTAPNRHNAYKNLGVVYQAQGRILEAAECFVRATEIAPTNLRAIGHLRVLLGRHPELAADHPGLIERMQAIYGEAWTQSTSN